MIGIIGGTGMLGSAIATGLVGVEAFAPGDLWVASRTDGGDLPRGVNRTTDNQELVNACPLVVLCVPPHAIDNLRIDASDRLVVSVMAGVTMARLTALTGANRMVRAISSPAAAHGLAFSPWFPSDAVTGDDQKHVTALFEACGSTARVGSEDHIDIFTALTGPVPGFVAFFAECMNEYATSRGIVPKVAEQAIRQLFLGAGRMMAEGDKTPSDHVREMIDYAGTTAAGLAQLKQSPIATELAKGLDAAVDRSRRIATGG